MKKLFKPDLSFFIDLGFYTVPIFSTIERSGNTKVFTPSSFKNYRKEKNTENAISGHVLTGKKSGVTVLDCDNKKSYDFVKSLLPKNYFFYAKSIGKEGGSFFFKFDPSIETSKITKEDHNLEIKGEGAHYFLPTIGNKTKEFFGNEKTQLKEIPEKLKTFLIQAKLEKENLTKVKKEKTHLFLFPYVKELVESDEIEDNSLFIYLTPKAFKNSIKYIKKGFIHPQDIGEGERNNYLVRVSAILGADPSIDKDLYLKVINKINSLLPEPLETDELMISIANPMISGSSSIDGVPIWVENEDWEDNNRECVFKLKNGKWVSIFYDDYDSVSFIHYHVDKVIKKFLSFSALSEHLEMSTGREGLRKYIKKNIPLIKSCVNPREDFGLLENGFFNCFNRTEYLAIIENGGEHNYSKGTVFKDFFTSFLPDKEERLFFLRFLKTRLTTFDFTPLILYLIGVPGSGKDTVCNLINKILGGFFIKVSSDVFIEKANAWLFDNLIAQLDEYGHTLSKGETQTILGKLKSFSGSPQLSMRAMGKDTIAREHNCNFILTANSNTIPIEPTDRRFVLLSTPNNLLQIDKVSKLGLSKFINILLSDEEIKAFCYYLYKKIEVLTLSEYNTPPPFAKGKLFNISDSWAPLDTIFYSIKNSFFEKLYGLYEEHNLLYHKEELYCLQGWEQNRIYTFHLFKLYLSMTEQHANENHFKARVKKWARLNSYKINYSKIKLKCYFGEGNLSDSENLSYLEISGLKEFLKLKIKN